MANIDEVNMMDVLHYKFNGQPVRYRTSDSYDSLVWEEDNEIPKPSKEDVIAWNDDYLAHVKATNYINLRLAEYPSLDSLIVALIEDKEGRPNALNALIEARQLIKTKYPKETT